MLKQLKTLAEKIPYPIGHLMAYVPFSWRLGKEYPRYARLIRQAESWSDEERERYTVDHFDRIFRFAREHFPFYRDLYRKAGVSELEIRSVDDIRKVPVITKAMIREHLDEFSGSYRLNTGGTTGTPFAFYVDKNAWAREWAHMHRIWAFLGYDYRDLNLAFRGKNIGGRKFIYNPVHNEFLINTYAGLADFAAEFLALTRKHEKYFVHGYPSSVYNFIVEAEKSYPAETVAEILGKIRGMLLHSEFPYDYMKKKFEEHHLPWISWYGHSEMCILAYDKKRVNDYRPFPTYGLAEVVDNHLIGSSFHNFDMPLLRYDTGDLVEERSTTAHGLCKSFAITAGRSGDFVTDRNGKQIPLTSLIFGRHHRAFDHVEHLQIHQEIPGEATIYLITSKPLPENLSELFDLSHVEMNFKLEVRPKPVLTAAGKLRLKI